MQSSLFSFPNRGARAKGVISALLLLLFSGPLLPNSAAARPEMAGQNAESRFAAMDVNGDDRISREEFFAAQPQMKDAAFAAFDANADNFISLEEWQAFVTGHGKADPHETGAMPGMPSAPSSDAVPDLLMPPQEGK